MQTFGVCVEGTAPVVTFTHCSQLPCEQQEMLLLQGYVVASLAC
jgi:hypothetical protein